MVGSGFGGSVVLHDLGGSAQIPSNQRYVGRSRCELPHGTGLIRFLCCFVQTCSQPPDSRRRLCSASPFFLQVFDELGQGWGIQRRPMTL